MTAKMDNSHQTWDAKSYQSNTGFVSVYGEDVLSWLDPKPNQRILDLGCGDGHLTRKIIDAGAEVVGADTSQNFVAAARDMGIDARVVDGHALAFNKEFDAVFSNAALHWMLGADKVVAGVARALRPDGRFIGEFGGFGNVAAISVAMRAVGNAMGGDVALAGPWFFPTVQQYSAMLMAQGFAVRKITSFYRPTPLPTGVRGWLETMRAPFFAQFDDRQEEAYARVIDALEPSLCDHQGRWFADYVRLRFAADLTS